MQEDVHAHIEELVAEEHRLWALESEGNAGAAERQRLAEVKVELDRYWDLLRRRRAAAAAGASEDEVGLRSEDAVENYLQ
jgi:phage terminase Nu1 subunit (DNA packaging protein)